MPKVSVVIPTYQRASFLRETVVGLLAQTLADIELIVADDGSTDRTPEVMASFKDPRVRYLRREHLGMPLILNEGFAVARGEYIMTCHDHDIYDPSMLAELAGVLDRNPTAAYAHCGIIGVDDSGERELERHVRDYPELMPGRVFLVEELLARLDSRVSALTMVRSSVLGGAALDDRFEGCPDVELWLRLSTVGDVAYVKKSLIRVRQRDPSSQFYYNGCRLAAKALEAKKLYLEWVEDETKRAAIRKGWRKEVDRTGFSALLKALEGRQHQEIPYIAEFLQQEGTQAGARALTLPCRMPRSIALLALRSARFLWRAFRSRSL